MMVPLWPCTGPLAAQSSATRLHDSGRRLDVVERPGQKIESTLTQEGLILFIDFNSILDNSCTCQNSIGEHKSPFISCICMNAIKLDQSFACPLQQNPIDMHTGFPNQSPYQDPCQVHMIFWRGLNPGGGLVNH